MSLELIIERKIMEHIMGLYPYVDLYLVDHNFGQAGTSLSIYVRFARTQVPIIHLEPRVNGIPLILQFNRAGTGALRKHQAENREELFREDAAVEYVKSLGFHTTQWSLQYEYDKPVIALVDKFKDDPEAAVDIAVEVF